MTRDVATFLAWLSAGGAVLAAVVGHSGAATVLVVIAAWAAWCAVKGDGR